MQKSLPQKVHEYIKEHLRYKRWRRIVTAMACVVVFCTTYALILPAITMTGEAYCGIEEHTHSREECYERVLVCGYDETESAEESTSGHTHTDVCYDTRSILVCKEEESAGHAHDESCYDEAGNLKFGQEEAQGHSHSDGCYQEERVLICGLEETDKTETAHQHTDDCYEEQLVCQLEEHEHSLACFSNPEADVESVSVWERTLPQNLGDNWEENVVAVAKSQLGYTESTANYTVLEDGVTMKGYTRYGAWYGMPYDDWCAMFASFCLHYAGVPQTSVPYASGCIYWVEQLRDAGLYESAADCYPEPGFLVFFDTDSDGLADHVGIVTEVAEDGESIQTVEGNIGGTVVMRSYLENDSTILGYCVLPQNPNAQMDAVAFDDAIEINAISDTVPDLTDYLTRADIMVDGKKYVEGETLPASKEFSVSLGFSNIPGKNGQTIYTYTLPSEVTLPKDVTDGVLTDASGTQQGTYTVTKGADGRDVITVNLSEEYVASNDYLNINLEMLAKWNVDGGGEHEVDFGNDHVTKVTVDTDTKLAIDKTHRTTDKRNAEYSIVVEAVTEQTNVKLTDSVAHSYADSDGNPLGAALKEGGTITVVLTDKDGIVRDQYTKTITDQNSLTSYLAGTSFNMNAGDALTITYPMEFSESAAYTADANDLTLKTTNTATVTSAEMPEALTAQEDWSYVGRKSDIIQKKGELEGDSAKWDLTLNDGGNYPMAGTVVYDKLQSDKLSYDMTQPFVVKVYDRAGNLVRTDTISDWNNNADGLKLTDDGRGWEYTIPVSDSPNCYTYKISYYTNITDNDGSALNNAAGARFSQYPDVGIIGKVGKIDLGISKTGEAVDQENKIAEWTIKYVVNPNSGIITDFKITDYLPSYKNVDGTTVYSKLIDKDGNYVETAGNITDFCKNGNVFDITVSGYADESKSYTDDSAFAGLLDYTAWSEKSLSSRQISSFALTADADGNGFTLPAAIGEYKDGYVVTVKYRTQSDGIADGEELTNRVIASFTDLDGETRRLFANARVSFKKESAEDSVTLDKTGIYDTETGKAHYAVSVDTENVGFRGATSVTITDTYDSRMAFEENSYTLSLSLDGDEVVELPVYLTDEQDSDYLKTEKVENANGTVTWKSTYLQTPVYAEGQGGTVPFEVHTTVDQANHTLTVFLPYVYMVKQGAGTAYPTYQLDYDLTPNGTGRVYKDIHNVVTAVGDNGTRYGQAETTFSFGQYLTTKVLMDAKEHTHSELAGCYTYKMSGFLPTKTLTCPLSEDDPNSVLFKVRVDFGAADLKNMTQLIIDDFMDSSKLTPDLSKMQLRFVSKTGLLALSFEDVCSWAGVSGASYQTELTQTGMSVTVDLGQKSGKACTVDELCTAFNSSFYAKMIGTVIGEIDLREWKLELSYPAAVKGNVGETVRVTNKANLRGVDDSSSEVEYDKVIQGSSGSVSGQSYTLNLKKIDAQVTGTNVRYLSGATFALCDQNDTKLAEATTDTNGMAIFGTKGTGTGNCTLTPYTAYYLVETSAPEGFVLDTTKHWFYFTAPEGTQAQKDFTEEQKVALEVLGCVPMEMDGSIQIANSKTASFKIKKVDDKTGETLTGAEFRLYSNIDCQNEVQVARTSGDGIYLLDGLTPNITYYLKETIAPTGYEKDETVHTVTVAADGAITIDGLTWDENTLVYVYKNTKASYVLPETGGAGTTLFTIGGTLLLAGSLLPGYVLRRKRERRFMR